MTLFDDISVAMERGDTFRQTGKAEPSLYRTFQDPFQEEIQIDDKLYFVEEPVEIMDREVKRLKQSRIPIVKKLHPTAKRLSTDVSDFYNALKQEMVEDLKYFKSLENEVESLRFH
ncbi:hypothetical protein Tco_1468554 [Tanacetum coccineum]